MRETKECTRTRLGALRCHSTSGRTILAVYGGGPSSSRRWKKERLKFLFHIPPLGSLVNIDNICFRSVDHRVLGLEYEVPGAASSTDMEYSCPDLTRLELRL